MILGVIPISIQVDQCIEITLIVLTIIVGMGIQVRVDWECYGPRPENTTGCGRRTTRIGINMYKITAIRCYGGLLS